MSRRIQSLFLPGPAGRLEAVLEEPDEGEPGEAALVCHPHPQYGGTMHNKVVYRMARGLRRAQAAVLRFNYRGVNLSEGEYAHGEGELEDACAALLYLRRQYPDLPFTLAGFSFGARIALRLACPARAEPLHPNPARAEPSHPSNDTGARRVIAVGFPATVKDRVYLDGCTVPRVFIHSTHDQFESVRDLETLVGTLPEPKRLIAIEASDHFFAGALDRLEEEIAALP
ncbi:MAG TPA: alpha/beta fold hydrolase [Bryobacteraceae bacterium]